VDHPLRGDDDGPLVVVDLKGKKTVLDPGGAKGLAWTADGAEVWASKGTTVFSVSLGGRRRDLANTLGGVWLLDISRTGRALLAKATTRREITGLAPGETRERNLSWFDWSYPTDLSRDGRFVLFQEQARGLVGGEYPVYLRKTDGSAAAVRLGETLAVSLSPDGRWALSIQHASSDPRLLLLPTGAGQTRLLSPDPIRYLPWAAWLPDGRRILIGGASQGHRGRLYVRAIEGGSIQPVTPEGIRHYGSVVSPDGKFVTATTAEGQAFAFPVDGGGPRRLPGIGPDDTPVRWSTDPRFLFVAREGELPTKIERLDLETGKREPWKTLSPGDPAGVFSIEPILMTGDGRAYIYSYRRLLTQLFLGEGLK
jgi:WD40 repeat protein